MPKLIKTIVLQDGEHQIDYESLANKPDIKNITVSEDEPASTSNEGDLWFMYDVIHFNPTLNDNAWSDISLASKTGVASSVWAVGDTKAVELNGTVGRLAVNTTLYAYILGFDHNPDYEEPGITFGTFKTAATGGVDVCLVDSNYELSKTDGTKTFNMQHWGYNNYGGWKGCDMRYDILGSTNVAPSGYGANAVSGRVGYDPENYDIVNSPVANTLLAAFPQELRAIMKPNTKYTDNVAGGAGHVEANVTASTDYLWLLGAFEIFGTTSSSNRYEASKQARYQYYIDGGSRVKYKHSAMTTPASWWERSSYYNRSSDFCSVYEDGDASGYYSYYSIGVGPAFLI